MFELTGSKPLGLAPFTLDDFEQSLYHSDPHTSVVLTTEIHAALLNILIVDLTKGTEVVRPLAETGTRAENNTDYWEGRKGATAEMLRQPASALGDSWKAKGLSRDRKGWEAALVGCLWERASMETLPNYLDYVLHLLFEDKPAPTRPTWSTGPAQGSIHGLIASKPEKRYASLHFTQKLEIVAFLVEMVAQTGAMRDFMEESTHALTEVRKDQVEIKREWRKM
jgi:bromodomain adjacent to zinc finger domain protein 1A